MSNRGWTTGSIAPHPFKGMFPTWGTACMYERIFEDQYDRSHLVVTDRPYPDPTEEPHTASVSDIWGLGADGMIEALGVLPGRYTAYSDVKDSPTLSKIQNFNTQPDGPWRGPIVIDAELFAQLEEYERSISETIA